MFKIIKEIDFINENIIPQIFINEAFEFCNGVDEKDTIFIAMSFYLDCPIWTGDKVLIEGLSKKGFKNFITSAEIITYSII